MGEAVPLRTLEVVFDVRDGGRNIRDDRVDFVEKEFTEGLSKFSAVDDLVVFETNFVAAL